MKCSAHKRNGEPCNAPAVSGQAVCRVHGAGGKALERSILANTKHGRRSKYQMPDVLDDYERLAEDENILDLVDEVAAARATVQAFLRNFNSSIRLDAQSVQALLEAIESVSRVVERENKRRGSLNNAQLVLFMARVADVMNRAIAEHIPDEGQAERVRTAVRLGLSGVISGRLS